MFLFQKGVHLTCGLPVNCQTGNRHRLAASGDIKAPGYSAFYLDSIILCYQWIMLGSNGYNTPSSHHSCSIKKPFFSLTTWSFLAIYRYPLFDYNSPLLSSKSPTCYSSHGHFPSHLFISSTSTSPLGARWLNSSIVHCPWGTKSTNQAAAWARFSFEENLLVLGVQLGP